MPTTDLAEFRWLLSDDATPWLARTAEDPAPLGVQVRRLRKDLSAQRTHLVLEQVELRRRAAAKFDAATRMFFTRQALQQATDQWVAAYKAARFPAGTTLADLCCGIGGDLVALAQRGTATGVERDPAVALLAEANLRALGLNEARVVVRDAAEFRLDRWDAWHLDPDRRASGRRTSQVEWSDPSAQAIERLLAECGPAALKLAPAADVPEPWARRAELEWIGRDRQCRQLVAWFGPLAERPGQRRATLVSGGPGEASAAVRSVLGEPGPAMSVAARIGRYVFDPDATVVAARLVGALASEHGLEAVDASVAYLTGDRPIADPALGCFEVTDVLPLDLRQLKRVLSARGVGQLEIKKRGPTPEPEEIRRQLNLRGSGGAVLLLTPRAGALAAVLASRLG